ncbi:UNVERIFIED_ORG: hypothetical protein J2Y93_000499 [Pantoea agglomerans]
MPRLNHHAVAGEADILLRDDIRPADMCLFARRDADAAARRADSAEAFTLRRALLPQVVSGFAAADGEADTVDIPAAGLVQNGVADVTGIERRAAVETILVGGGIK